MSTTAAIAVKLNDGTFRQVYCHYDGYVKGTGKTLFEYYNDQELAERVTSLGDVSWLGPEYHPDIYSPHTWCDPQPGVTVLYGRERGEPDCHPVVFHSEEEFQRDGMIEDFNYLFKDGEWLVFNARQKPYEWKPLAACNL